MAGADSETVSVTSQRPPSESESEGSLPAFARVYISTESSESSAPQSERNSESDHHGIMTWMTVTPGGPPRRHGHRDGYLVTTRPINVQL